MNNVKNIEDIYSLSPLQENMLAYSLYTEDTSALYLQWSCSLRGTIIPSLFRQAWQLVVDKHPSLRTAFIWKNRNKPHQVVYRQAILPFEHLDWSNLTSPEQQNNLADLLVSDRMHGFSLAKAPLMRVTLIHLSANSYQLVVSYHHLIMDGWSESLVFEEVLSLYHALCQQESVSPGKGIPFRNYIMWLKQQDVARNKAFWKDQLQGFTAPALLIKAHNASSVSASRSHFNEEQLIVPLECTQALQKFAQQYQLTLNTLFQGAWALLLSRYSDDDDLIMGLTVSGRPPDLVDSDIIIGQFINNLPMRVRIPFEASLLSWLKGLQQQQFLMNQHSGASLEQIREWSDAPKNMPLFQSILLFQNVQVRQNLLAGDRSLQIQGVHHPIRTNYPLTIVAEPGDTVILRMIYDTRYFEQPLIARMLAQLQNMLNRMHAYIEQPLSAIALTEEKYQLFVKAAEHRASFTTFTHQPRTPLEEVLQEIWAQVLGVEQVGIYENFFDLGGDSIRSIQVCTAAQQKGLHCSLELLFKHPTIHELAHVLDATEPVPSLPTPLLPFALLAEEDRARIPDEVEDAYPLTRLQTGMLFHSAWHTNSATYHDVFSFHLQLPYDYIAFEDAIRSLMLRHPVLRTAFDLTHFTEPLQLVYKECQVPLQVEELQTVPADQQEKAIADFQAREKRQGFESGKAPYFRIFIHRRTEDTFQFTLSFNHAILDGWSVATLLTELFRSYCNKVFALPPEINSLLTLFYRDFVALERQAAQDQEARRFWESKLSDCTASRLSYFASSGTEEVLQDTRTCYISVPPAVLDLLKSLARTAGVPLKSVLLAAHLRTISVVTGQIDVTTGVVSNGRLEEKGGEQILGLFLNTLPFRYKLGGGTWTDFVREVFDLECQIFPFRRYAVLESLKEQHKDQLFDSVFVYTNFHVYQALEERSQVLTVDIFEQTNFPLVANFSLSVSGNSLDLYLRYDVTKLSEEQVEKLGTYYSRTLQSMAEQPAERYEVCSPLSAAEREWLWHVGNTPATCYPVAHCLHTLFEQQVACRPDAIAVTDGTSSLSYEQLNRRANRLAHYLRARGVGAETLVGLCMERSSELLVGILAILKAGGAYVPLDPASPTERLSFLVADAGISLVLTQSSLVTHLNTVGSELVCLDSDWREIEQFEESNPRHHSLVEQVAYVIYTSGSTGKPKGVQVTHKNVVRLFSAVQAQMQFGEQDVWTLFHSFAFDFSVWEIWGALLAGGKVVVVPYIVSRSPEQFAALLDREQVTVLNQTPSAFRQLMRQMMGTPEGGGYVSLRLIIFGGEALDVKSLLPWFQRYGEQHPQLINMYGITETTVHVTVRPLRECDAIGEGKSVLGSPLADLECYVLDQHMQLLPPGVAGELYVGGAGLARGYLRQAALTAERFVPHPFSQEQGTRLYRSGDRARFLPTGELEYLGRIDTQVKLRGYRIEVGEIEAALREHPQLQEAVVVLVGEDSEEKRLAAYVVPKQGNSVSVQELRGFVRARIPDYMVPALFVMLERLPLTLNGKVDYRALPPPLQEDRGVERAYVEPGTPVEKLLADIWAEVLDVGRVGVDENFFELGGDSIYSIRLQAKAQARGIFFSVQQLFEHPTIEQLAQVASQQAACEAGSSLAAFSLLSQADREKLPAQVEDAYPLTRLQLGMLFHSSYNISSTAYHDIFSYHLEAPLEVQKLREALALLVRRHPMLRTSFNLTDYSQPLQLVHQHVDVPIRIEDISALAMLEQDVALSSWFSLDKTHPFLWQEAPLLRFCVHLRGEDHFQFTVSFHHAILDGWSVASLCAELFQLYTLLLKEGRARPGEPPRLHFGDFVRLEQQALASEEQKRFWATYLEDCSFVSLPGMASARQKPFSRQICRHMVPLSSHVWESLKQISYEMKLPLKSVLMAAHVSAMCLLAGKSDIVTGYVANGRPEESEGEKILGLFLNTLPFRLKLAGGSWRELIGQVFAMEQRLLPYRRYPLAEIQQLQGGQPLFETAFNFVHFHIYQAALDRSDIQFLGLEFFEETNFALIANFSVHPVSSQIEFTLCYDTDRIAEEQIERLTAYYTRILESMALRPDERYEASDFLSAQEREWLLFHAHTPPAHYPVNHCLHTLFEQQAERHPQAPAIVAGKSYLTYEQLNRRANQLAHYLRACGVRNETLVGLCMERSVELVVAILAILKAGGAYVPLDPASPAERLTLLAADAHVHLVLTRSGTLPPLDSGTGQIPVVYLEQDGEAIARGEEQNPEWVTTTAQAAYVIYTSGSTGRPKGVQVSHENVVRLFAATQAQMHWNEQDVWTLFHSYAFDFSVWEIWGALLSGGKLVVVPYEVSRSPELFFHLLCQEQVTVLNQTPPAFRQLMPVALSAKAEVLARLRMVIFGGEALDVQGLLPWFEHYGEQQPQLINMYGITETTVHVTVRPLRRQDALAQGKSVIGNPLPDMQCYVLDEHMQLVPPGVAGELYVGGAGLARGYLYDPALTAERFLPHPFSQEAGARLYRSGDLVRMLSTGELEYLGRLDKQVKVRGFRIEVGEIEAMLKQHGRVRDAVVVVEERSGEKRLVAYVVPGEMGKLHISELRAFLRERMSEYMLPALFVLLEQLPLTLNGKLDYRALPSPKVPRSATERMMELLKKVEQLSEEEAKAMLLEKDVPAKRQNE